MIKMILCFSAFLFMYLNLQAQQADTTYWIYTTFKDTIHCKDLHFGSTTRCLLENGEEKKLKEEEVLSYHSDRKGLGDNFHTGIFKTYEYRIRNPKKPKRKYWFELLIQQGDNRLLTGKGSGASIGMDYSAVSMGMGGPTVTYSNHEQEFWIFSNDEFVAKFDFDQKKVFPGLLTKYFGDCDVMKAGIQKLIDTGSYKRAKILYALIPEYREKCH